MTAPHSLFDSLQQFDLGNGQKGSFYSLPALEAGGVGRISRLPVSIRIILESVLRHCDGKTITEEHVRELANWQPNAKRTEEVPFVVSRIVLQDFTGVPLLVDLAAMRSAVAEAGKDPKMIEPSVPVDLVVDHSVQVDFAGVSDALQRNLAMEFRRNRERYQFLKWGTQAFNTFRVIPPGIGIVHQVNLEYLAKGFQATNDGIYYPDTLVGTDSHTTMINGLGIVGWGVGGIEAEAGMLGQPVYFLTPDVVGVYMKGSLQEGVTATDLALTVTEMLRKANVVGKFVEFYGPGAAELPVVDRATIANMSPEYGATMGFFPVDSESVQYLRSTGRSEAHCQAYENFYRAQGLFGMPEKGDIDYSMDLELDLSTVAPSVAGPKRPQDRIEVPKLKSKFRELFEKSTTEGGYGKSVEELDQRGFVKSGAGSSESTTDSNNTGAKENEDSSELEMRDSHPTPDSPDELPREAFRKLDSELHHGSVVIAAITSCTNTSNPSVMLGAGLVAKNAVEKGLTISPVVKCSLAPGSRVVTDYLNKTGLQEPLDQLGFNLVGYGCTTCIGNSGPLAPAIEEAIHQRDLVVSSVLSGNRNFEARIHQSVKANFLMSPPLVVAYALAGRTDVDLTNEPLGHDQSGNPVYLKDIWPSLREIRDLLRSAIHPDVFRQLYKDFEEQNPEWNEIPAPTGEVYEWDPDSTYIQKPPFFENFQPDPVPIQEIHNARALGIFGDSVTTDHISPAGTIKKSSPAGRYLIEKGVNVVDFNSYGSRRGNDRVMTRGTFANVRIKNLMVPGSEGGVTQHQPSGEQMTIFDAAQKYAEENVPLVVFAGKEYGTGSSRDWAAKGTKLLGVRAVIAESFERIHRSNLVGMGVLPLQFREGTSPQTLGLDGSETYDILGLDDDLSPRQDVTLRIHGADGSTQDVPVQCRIDTPVEIEYYQNGGILDYVLRRLLSRA